MIGKIFKAYDVRATYPDPLNEDAAWKVGYATGAYLRKENGDTPGTVLVSRDMRPHSPKLAGALIEGLRAAEMDVVDLGMCDTSFMYFAINHVDGAIGGVQTTASHNPAHYNGFKISKAQARPVGADTGLKDIQATAESLGDTRKPPTGGLRELDLWEPYREHILGFLSPLSRKLKVFVDASNGMAGKLVPQVFEGVENLEIVPLNFEITGSFVHEPNPLVAENMIPTQKGVTEHGADLGACFDGDADRCMLVDDRGQIIGCDHLTALLAHHFVAQARTDPAQHTPTTVVYDLRSSKVVEETLRDLGVTPKRSRVGHVHMKAVLRETGGVFGGELSGHFYFRDNFFADSGAIAFAAVLSVLNAHPGKSLAELVDQYRRYPQSGEINFRNDDKDGTMAKLREMYGGKAEIDDLDGVTVDAFEGEGWWFNVRASNTEPLLRLNAEARDEGQLEELLDTIRPLLGEEDAGH